MFHRVFLTNLIAEGIYYVGSLNAIDKPRPRSDSFAHGLIKENSKDGIS